MCGRRRDVLGGGVDGSEDIRPICEWVWVWVCVGVGGCGGVGGCEWGGGGVGGWGGEGGGRKEREREGECVGVFCDGIQQKYSLTPWSPYHAFIVQGNKKG